MMETLAYYQNIVKHRSTELEISLNQLWAAERHAKIAEQALDEAEQDLRDALADGLIADAAEAGEIFTDDELERCAADNN